MQVGVSDDENSIKNVSSSLIEKDSECELNYEHLDAVNLKEEDNNKFFIKWCIALEITYSLHKKWLVKIIKKFWVTKSQTKKWSLFLMQNKLCYVAWISWLLDLLLAVFAPVLIANAKCIARMKMNLKVDLLEGVMKRNKHLKLFC